MSAEKGLPWIIKYRPKSLKEYVNQETAVAIITSWIKDWEKRAPTKKAVLLYGPPGVGKTSLIEALANDYGYEIVETNASDYRRRDDIYRKVYNSAIQGTLTGRKKLILLDEVDGLSSTGDKGGIEAIVQLITQTKNPIILTANNAFHPDLKPIRDLAVMIELKNLNQKHVLTVLKIICEREGVECEDAGLKVIYEKNRGDLRACINDLQSIAEVYGKVNEELATELTYYRDRELNPFDTLRNIFTSKYVWQSRNAISHSEVDTDTLIEWLSENIPVQLTDPEDAYLAFQALSRADVYRGIIKKTGNYDFLAYITEMIGPAISFSRKKTKFKWLKYNYPSKLKMLSETKRSRELLNSSLQKLSKRLSQSTSKSKKDLLPYLRSIYRLSPPHFVQICRSYGITVEEAAVIVGDKQVEKAFAEMAAERQEKSAEKAEISRTQAKRAKGRTSKKRGGQTQLF
ncbi:replication factor C large subunit [Fervidicoccus fontis]|uniref:Replication factor C large subunit n=1 Tax=Fervidicoccus fontis (strain DSM 19380 / JCM 18336 / VKM B-2539 / Kam940) TaxID=1163730 RepID=I0A2Z0_FERFK|nr:replication factor C large subunit [Fervidicoccus fontis]AFH43347.1 replication factor C large subunit [Fervidicoccus fontis Kam940]